MIRKWLVNKNAIFALRMVYTTADSKAAVNIRKAGCLLRYPAFLSARDLTCQAKSFEQTVDCNEQRGRENAFSGEFIKIYPRGKVHTCSPAV